MAPSVASNGLAGNVLRSTVMLVNNFAGCVILGLEQLDTQSRKVDCLTTMALGIIKQPLLGPQC